MIADYDPSVPFDIQIPVLVIGAGAAGLCAALAASDGGAEVLVAERDPVARGSTSMSQGYVCAAGSKLQKEQGIEDDGARFYADIMARTKCTADPVIAQTMADHSGASIDWLVDRHNIPFRMNISWAGFFGHSVNRMHGVPSRTGEELHGALMRAVEGAGGLVVTGAHVDQLYADAAGRVQGARMRRADGSVETIGCDALVLATCGFGANHEMVREHIPDFGRSSAYRYFGHEGNEGEGIQWGQALGAAVGSMDAFQGYGALADPYGVIVNYDMVLQGAVTVNVQGRRFSNEVEDISAQALNVLDQPEGIAWIVFDDARREIVENLPEFRELNALGAVRSAHDAAGLAARIGVPADALLKTLAETVEMATGRMPCPFGRDFTGNPPLSGALHAIRTTGALFHTQGGLKVDGNAQVLRSDGSRLPNLFAAGGAACSISGRGVDGYLPAAGLAMAVVLGRLAGAEAARLATTKA